MEPKDKNFQVIHNQRWYQLGTILSTSFSLPMILIGHQLALSYNANTAICSIIIGNIILWLIGISVISMASEDKSNAIANVKSYIGEAGGIFMWCILLVSIVNWFMYQLNSVIPSIGSYFETFDRAALLKLGVGTGFITTLLSIGGMRLLKSITTFSFPPIFLYYIYSISQSKIHAEINSSISLSISAIIVTITMLLPGMINLPTLFRHAKSKTDSVLGLSFLMILISFYECSTIWLNVSPEGIFLFTAKTSIFSISSIIFIIITLIYMNLINIYFASACWETYISRFEGAKGSVIIGLMGIAAYTFIQIRTPIIFIADLTNCYLGNLGIILMIGFLVRIIVQHRPRPKEKLVNGLSWLGGCIVSTVLILKNHEDVTMPLLAGVGMSAFIFLLIIFVEETVWSIRKIVENK